MAIKFKKIDCDTWNPLMEDGDFKEFCANLDQAGEKGVSILITDIALSLLQNSTDGTQYTVADGIYPSDQDPRETKDVVFMGFAKVPPKHVRFKKAW